jgi:thiamine-phosphate pyrophosphorylase
MRPVICMITDGRLAAGLGGPALVEIVRSAARAGVHLIQLRERALDDRDLALLAGACVDAVRGTRARIVVNDRLDVAVASRAHGVHLRGDSFPAQRARTIAAPGFLIGRSVHSVEEAKRASEDRAVDYLLFGTVFDSRSKPGCEPAGVAMLADAARASLVPLLAVGGITGDNAALVARAGADGVAAIGLFAGRPPGSFAETVRRVAGAFDTPQTGS